MNNIEFCSHADTGDRAFAGDIAITVGAGGGGGNLTVAGTLTAKKLIVTESIDLPDFVVEHHNHSGADLTSGTIPPARLPLASGTEKGAVSIDTNQGLVIVAGRLGISVSTLAPKIAAELDLADTYTAASDFAGFQETVEATYATSEALASGLDDLASSVASNYATQTALSGAIAALSATVASTYATQAALSDAVDGINATLADDYATQTALSDAVSGINSTLTTYYVTQTALSAAVANINATLNESYATRSWVSAALTNYTTTTALTNAVNTINANLTANYAPLSALANYSLTGHEHLTVGSHNVPSSGIITLEEGKTHYQKTVGANTAIGFNAEDVSGADVITFELLIKMGATVYPVNFTSAITWLNGDEPYFNDANTAYLLAFRSYNGGDSWVGGYQGRF